jgi:hypothetical protein
VQHQTGPGALDPLTTRLRKQARDDESERREFSNALARRRAERLGNDTFYNRELTAEERADEEKHARTERDKKRSGALTVDDLNQLRVEKTKKGERDELVQAIGSPSPGKTRSGMIYTVKKSPAERAAASGSADMNTLQARAVMVMDADDLDVELRAAAQNADYGLLTTSAVLSDMSINQKQLALIAYYEWQNAQPPPPLVYSPGDTPIILSGVPSGASTPGGLGNFQGGGPGAGSGTDSSDTSVASSGAPSGSNTPPITEGDFKDAILTGPLAGKNATTLLATFLNSPGQSAPQLASWKHAQSPKIKEKGEALKKILLQKIADKQWAEHVAATPTPSPGGAAPPTPGGAGVPRPHHMKAYLKKVMDRADASGKRSIMPHLREIRHMHKLLGDTDDYLTSLK